MFFWIIVWNNTNEIRFYLHNYEFQSLFFWIIVWNLLLLIPKVAIRCIVSILVFLDHCLEPIGKYEGLTPTESFNPCFSGSLSGTIPSILKYSMPCRFQSLFFWIIVWNCEYFPIIFMFESGFNPCFSGSLSGTCFNCCIWSSVISVSILVFLDHCLEHTLQVFGRLQQVMFQSLFFWIIVWNFG